MRTTISALVLLSALASAQETKPDPARELFVKNCALCHGETGDGKGTQNLDNPARSFKAGGFSYGNTPEALLRTITYGIPGTPMPSFSAALNEAQRKDLARYVITLGPPVVDVKTSDTRLVVGDTPLFARGKLPPIVEGAPEIVRGLLVGTPDGLTFQYRVDDLRLLGVRRGDFVERRDWSGRGGDALEPLGKLVHVCAAGKPEAEFRWSAFANKVPLDSVDALVSALRFTRSPDGRAHIGYTLSEASSPPAIDVDEQVAAYVSRVGSGFTRHVSLRGLDREHGWSGTLSWRLPKSSNLRVIENSRLWFVGKRTDGAHEIHWVRLAPPKSDLSADSANIALDPERRLDAEIEVVTLLCPIWNAETRAAFEKETKP